MKIGLKRLLKLADILDVADAEHRKRGEPMYSQSTFSHLCGSPACALGHWAATNQKRGWKLTLGGVKYKGYSVACDSEDVRNEFGLSWKEAANLFSYSGCDSAQTAKQAAKYIRKFVARKQKEL